MPVSVCRTGQWLNNPRGASGVKAPSSFACEKLQNGLVDFLNLLPMREVAGVFDQKQFCTGNEFRHSPGMCFFDSLFVNPGSDQERDGDSSQLFFGKHGLAAPHREHLSGKPFPGIRCR